MTWTNTGERPHTATDRGGTFDTKPIAPGASAEVTLSTPGTYFYFCRINPAKMNRVLTVEPGADEPGRPGSRPSTPASPATSSASTRTS